MIQEYSGYLLNVADLVRKTGDTFKGIQFDDQSQAIEIFALQSLAMCASHCQASALLLQGDFAGEAVIVLRPILEILFDIHWILLHQKREERLEMVYKLEANPYAQWDKETKLIAEKYPVEKAKSLRGTLDEIAVMNPHLTVTNSDGSKSFKAVNDSLADRMGEQLRPLYYHIYRYSSLFAHPTPANKNLYLKGNITQQNNEALEESLKQFVAYSLLSIGFIIGFAEEVLGLFSPSAKGQRDDLFKEMIELIEKANKRYFLNPLQTEKR